MESFFGKENGNFFFTQGKIAYTSRRDQGRVRSKIQRIILRLEYLSQMQFRATICLLKLALVNWVLFCYRISNEKKWR